MSLKCLAKILRTLTSILSFFYFLLSYICSNTNYRLRKMQDEVKYCHVPIFNDKSFVYDHVHVVWNEQITFHQHAEWELSYVITGSGTRIVGDLMETFSNGEVVLIPPNIPHCWSFDKNIHDDKGKIENITIIFPDLLFDKCISVFPETKRYISSINQYKQAIRFEGYTLQMLQKIMTAMLLQNDMEQLSSLINLFVVMASSNETCIVGSCNKQDYNMERFQEVFRFIANNYQQNISLEDVANYIHMNRSSFCTFLRRTIGKPFFTILNEYRIESSCLMLRETTMPIAEICYAVGFNDVPYYNRTFKKLKGITPKDYRAKY